MLKENGNKIDKSKKEGSKKSWTFLVIAILLIGHAYLYDFSKAKKTDWTEVKSTMLTTGDIDRMAVVNNEWVEVYIKKDRLSQEQYKGFYPTHPGPHYFFNIGSIEVFEQRFAEVQKEFSIAEQVKLDYTKRTNWIKVLLSWTLPFLLIVGIWYGISWMTLTQNPNRGTGRLFNFGKTSPKIYKNSKGNKIRFSDVAGLESAKAEVEEMVNFLKNPDKYTRLGAKIPKGVILVGPPGTGKTLLAKAVAGEADVAFFSMSGAEFVEMFVGVGASRVRDLFQKAKNKAPSIIFIDEIDAIGRSRGKANVFHTNEERESTLNQLLNEMDGFSDNSGVIVLAATNRPDVLDKALLRPGRFDRHIYLELPNLKERVAIFKVHTKKLLLSSTIDLDKLATRTPGFSGADIANLCNEAALIAARENKDTIESEDFTSALDRVVGGLERKGKIVLPDEKKIIAFHEAGHATIGWFLESGDQLMKVTIVPRGKSLGSAWYLSEEHHVFTKSALIDRICIALGGRAAEQKMLGEVSSGAVDDLEKATKLAYLMIAEYGLSEVIGNISFHDSTGANERSFHKMYSEETAQMIDKEVRNLLDYCYDQALQTIDAHQTELTILAERLLEKEVVEQEELEEIFGQRNNSKTSQELLPEESINFSQINIKK